MAWQAVTKQQISIIELQYAEKLFYEPPLLFILQVETRTQGGIGKYQESDSQGWFS